MLESHWTPRTDATVGVSMAVSSVAVPGTPSAGVGAVVGVSRFSSPRCWLGAGWEQDGWKVPAWPHNPPQPPWDGGTGTAAGSTPTFGVPKVVPVARLGRSRGAPCQTPLPSSPGPH